jgi:integrase
MTITQRGHSWQSSRYVKGKRVRKQFPTREAALKYEDPAAADGMDMLSAQNAAYKRYWRGSKDIKRTDDRATVIVNHFGSRSPIKDIRAQDVDDLIDMLRESGRADATINRYLATLNKMFKVARRYQPQYTTPDIERLREGPGRTRFFNKAEVLDILNTVRVTLGETAVADLIAVAVETGLRRGELLKLTSADMLTDDKWRPSIRVRDTKNGQTRVVPIKKYGDAHQIILATSTPGQLIFQITPQKIQSVWDAARRIMGFADDEEFVFHTLRHTYCTRLAERGVGLQSIMKLAGHSSPLTTMRYVKVTHEMLLEIADSD